MAIVVTGAAGFIGYHTCLALLNRGENVIGIDNLNDYYDPQLKQVRLEELKAHKGFSFYVGDIADRASLEQIIPKAGITHVVHLAAQAGVRYSLAAPEAYVHSNVLGQVQILEWCRTLPKLKNLVYASSSSVYGANQKVPFSESDPVDNPVSPYAATKRSAELLTESHSRIYGLPCTGLRFFTVYGPYGRPDMAYFSFTKAIAEEKPINLFEQGRLKRDFTYVDDIIQGVIASLGKPPSASGDKPAHRIYNLGNNQPELVTELVALIEKLLGKKAQIRFAPMQPGDVEATWADISRAEQELGFQPVTPLAVGIERFVDWYKGFYK